MLRCTLVTNLSLLLIGQCWPAALSPVVPHGHRRLVSLGPHGGIFISSCSVGDCSGVKECPGAFCPRPGTVPSSLGSLSLSQQPSRGTLLEAGARYPTPVTCLCFLSIMIGRPGIRYLFPPKSVTSNLKSFFTSSLMTGFLLASRIKSLACIYSLGDQEAEHHI